VRRQVLERLEAGARGPLVGVAVEVRDRLAQTDVSNRPRARTREMPGEEPLSRPFADPAKRDELRLHLLVRENRESVEVDVGAREADGVLRFPAREGERDELALRP